MRNLFILTALLFCAGVAEAQTQNCPVTTAPWNCTQGAQNFTNGSGVTSVTASTATPIANGSLIVVAAGTCWNAGCNSGTGTITITDNGGSNSYICPTNDSLTGISRTACYVCNSLGGPTGITMTLSPAATGSFPNLIWNSFTDSNGAIPSSCLDQKSGTTFSSGSGTSASISTSSPTTRNNDLIWSFIGGASTIATNNSFQYLTENVSTNAATEMKNGATPGTYATGWTFASSTWSGVELAFFGPNISSTGNFPMVIKFRSTLHYRIPWDNRKAKLEVVTI